MDQKTKKFIEHMRRVSLEPHEKAAIRERILREIHDTPRVRAWKWFLPVPRFKTALASLVVAIILLNSMLAASAQKALPGEFLYPIKIKVNEPIIRAFANSSLDKKAKFEVGLVEKRLKEAETLSKQNKLNKLGEKHIEKVKIEIIEQVTKATSAEAAIEPPVSVEPKTIIEKNDAGKDKRVEKLDKILERHQDIIEKLELKQRVRKDLFERHIEVEVEL